jgi:hypothetical protein
MFGRPVLSVEGSQFFSVQAENINEARYLLEEDGGNLESEEIEVQKLGKPYLIEVIDGTK